MALRVLRIHMSFLEISFTQAGIEVKTWGWGGGGGEGGVPSTSESYSNAVFMTALTFQGSRSIHVCTS